MCRTSWRAPEGKTDLPPPGTASPKNLRHRPAPNLWLHLGTKPDGLHAFGYGIEVRQELRRRGYGRAIAAAAETKCREMRVVSIGLTVFGPNKAAQSLYEHLGFEVTVLQVRKHLSTRQQGVTSANR